MFPFIIIGLLTFNVSSVFAIGSTPEAKNMRLVGFNNLQARSAYQPIAYQQDGVGLRTLGTTAGQP
jgi:hypothetical protein